MGGRSLLVLSQAGLAGSVLGHLQREGLEVAVSTSALEASALLVKQPPDAFYVSLAGLQSNGPEVVALARQYTPEALIVAGLRPEERPALAGLLEAGADACLLEPVVAEELLALLRQGWAREAWARRRARHTVGRKAVSQLARVIAHQVNNPLGTLSGWLQMLSVSGSNPATLRKVVESARVEMDRLEKVVQTLLILSEQMTLRRGTFQLDEAVRSALANGTGSAAEVPVTFSPGLPLVVGEQGLLAEALSELLAGEVLLSAGTRSLEVSTSVNGRMVEVDVVLAGEGLEKQGLEELLDPLRVFDEKGADAALAFSRAVCVVRVHGGEVVAERGLDDRAHLLIRLPAAVG